jgi:hypothetical protein
MQQSTLHSIPEPGIARRRTSRENFRLHAGRAAAAEARPATEASPLHSVQTLATTMFVMSVAAGWIVAASLASAPLIGAGELLSRAARTSGH